MYEKHEKLKYLYVGIDIHKEIHVAVIIDCWNDKLGEITFDNKPSAFPKFVEKVKEYCEEGITPVYGLEDVGGNGRALAVFLTETNEITKEVNPAYSSSERKNNPMTQKNDSWDAQCIAKVLFDKLKTLPDVKPDDLYWTLKQLVGRRNTMVNELSTVKTQLHGQLALHYPSYKKIFSEVDGKTALAFWHKYPSQQHLKDISLQELKEFLLDSSNNSCSTRKAEQILGIIKSDGDTTRGFQRFRDVLIQSMVDEIKFLKEEIKKMEKEMGKILKLLDYKLQSMPGINLVTEANLIANIGDILRFANPNKLAKYAGIAPVKFSSAGKGKEQMSEQGRRELNKVFYMLAIQQIQISKGSKTPRNPILYEYYKRKLSENKHEIKALMCVMRRLVNIIYGLMKNKTEYRMEYLSKK